MRIITFLTLTLLGSLSLSAQSTSEIARAAHLSNAHFLIKSQSGIGRLNPVATSENGTLLYRVDERIMGPVFPHYLGFKEAVASLDGETIEALTFDSGATVKFTHKDGRISGVAGFSVTQWNGDRPTQMKTVYTPTTTFKKFDFMRTDVAMEYDGDNLTILRGVAELAKAKSIEKINKTERFENFRADFVYDPAQQMTTGKLTTYEIKKGALTPKLREPFGFTVKALTPNRRIVYKMTNGKADIVFDYDSKGRKKVENAKYRFMGYVNNVTTYTYEGDQILPYKQVIEVYSQGQQLSSVVTDNFEVDYSDPDNPTRTYLGGERHNKAGKKIGERRKGEERKLNPDGSWGSWRKSKQVGR